MSVRFAADAANLGFMTERAALVRIVERIMEGEYASDDEVQALVEEFEAAVPHPNAAGLIFWPLDHFDHEPTPADVVDRALGYRAIEL